MGSPRQRPGAARLAPLLWLPLCLALAGSAAWAPFGQPSLTTTMAAYGEVYAEVWDDFGFARALGVPMLGLTGETVLDRLPYAHHPPMGWWPPYFGRGWWGKSPFGFKVFPALWSGLALWLCCLCVHRAAGFGTALAFALLLLSLPGFAAHAALPGVESLVLAAVLFFFALEEQARKSHARALTLAAGCAYLVGTQCGWSFHFAWVGLLASELMRPAADRRWTRVIAFGVLSVAGIAIVFGHLAAALGGPAAVLQAWRSTLGNVVLGETVVGPDGPLAIGLRDTFCSMWALWHGPLAGPLSLAAGLYVLCMRRLRERRLARLGVASIVVGYLSIGLFHGRSSTHGYYWYLATPGQALLLAVAAQGALEAARSDRARRRFVLLLLIALCALLATNLARGHAEIRAAFGRGGDTLVLVAEAMTAISKPDDFWLVPDYALQEAMVLTPRRFVWTAETARIEAVLAARDRGELPMGRLLIAMVPSPRTAELMAFAEARIAKGRGRWLNEPGMRIAAL